MTECGTTTGYGADVKQEESDYFIALQVPQVPMLARHFPSESFWVWHECFRCAIAEKFPISISYILSLLIFFLYQTLLHVLLFCLTCFSLKIIIQIISVIWELPYPWSYLLLFESSEVPSLWDGRRWLDHSSLLEVVPQIHIKILYLFIVLQPILSVCLLYLHTIPKAGWHLVPKAVI